mgnify:CR=1 FL=1
MPRKRSVALAAWGEEGLLLVLRPQDDPEFPGAWGLPAVSLQGEETLEEAALRVAREKLGAEVAEAGPIAFGVEERPGYTLELWVYEGKLLGRPRLPEPKPGKTYYAAFRFGRVSDSYASQKTGEARLPLQPALPRGQGALPLERTSWKPCFSCNSSTSSPLRGKTAPSSSSGPRPTCGGP